MWTTLELDERLVAAARRRAEEQGTTLSAIVAAALATALGPTAPKTGAYRFQWKTHRGSSLPGIDLTSRDALIDAMEGRRRS